MGCFMLLMKSLGLSFLNSGHSVMIMAQSAFFRHVMGESAYFILFLKIDFAVDIAAGS